MEHIREGHLKISHVFHAHRKHVHLILYVIRWSILYTVFIIFYAFWVCRQRHSMHLTPQNDYCTKVENDDVMCEYAIHGFTWNTTHTACL